MNLLSGFVCLTIIAVVAAEYGYYVPKSFYRIDENGQASPIYVIDQQEQIHQRFRRAPQYNPNQGFFNQGFGFPNFPQFPQPGQGGNFQGVSTSQTVQHGGSNIEGRFGGDSEPKVSGSTTTITGQDGKYTQTHHKLGTDGKWHADSTHRGSFNG